MTEAPLPPLLATLFERLEGPESLEIEFKSAKGGLPNSLWETVSAFANTQGGWVVLGVVEREEEFVVEGVTNPQQQLQTLHNLLRNPQKISHSVCSATDASSETLDGRNIIVIRVPAASRKDRPVYLNQNPYTGTYVRRQGGDYRCTKREVDRMMREASDSAMDSTVLDRYSLGDLDEGSLAVYRRRYQTLYPASPWNAYDDLRFLGAIGGYRLDRESGKQGLTVAGLLMFGRPEPLREWRGRHLIDYRYLASADNADTRWDDRVTWEGSLLGAFDAIYPRVVSNLPVSFRLRDGRRVDEGPGHVALREALVNLLVHADYAEEQASLIKQAPDEWTFRNPGSSRVTEADLLTGDRSDPRNPELVRMFRLIGLAEEAGSGMPKIVQGWRELGFQLPSIDVGTERYEFSITLRQAHLLSEEDRHWLQGFGEHWSEPEQLALVAARHEGYVDNLRLRSLSGQHRADATRVLGNLRDRGLLAMIGDRRGAHYVLGPGITGARGLLPGFESFAQAGAEITQAGPEIAQAGPEIAQAAPEITQAGRGIRVPNSELWSQLVSLGEPMRRRPHVRSPERDEIVYRLCRLAPLSRGDLAQLLGRSEEYVRTIVRRLVSQGRLTYLYPLSPTHPRQQYLASTEEVG